MNTTFYTKPTLLALLLMVLTLNFTSCSNDDEPAPNPAVFAITPTTYTFKDIIVNKTGEHKFIIKNTGGENLKVESATLTGTNSNEFSTNFKATTLEATKSYTFSVTCKPKSGGKKIATLNFKTNVGDKKVELNAEVKEELKPVFAITPTSKEFAETEVGKTATQEFTITNKGNADLEITAVAINGENADAFSSTATKKTINAKENYSFIVSFTPKKSGNKTASLVLSTNVETQTITLTGTAKAVEQSNVVNIPDANFKAFLVGNSLINTNGDTEIQRTEAESYTGSIFCSNKNIADLTGIEAFKNLSLLYCYTNKITKLDLSKNTKIRKVACYNNQITDLNIKGCTQLTYLNCGENLMTQLDLSTNTALTEFWCLTGKLSSLDVSNCTEIAKIYAKSNALTTLNVNNCKKLTLLHCSNNSLSSIDLSSNTALVTLYCQYNEITALNLATNTALKTVYCYKNKLTALDMSNNLELTKLKCGYNEITTLNISKNTEMVELSCFRNKLTQLDVSSNTKLTKLDCTTNSTLSCIKVNATQLASIPTDWRKDTAAKYNTTCK